MAESFAQIPAVDHPDSASHFYCEVLVRRAGGYKPNTTHHLVNGTCKYCGLTDTQIRTAAGLR
jgi:hypothetical protein